MSATSRSVAPAARCRSPQTSASAAIEPAVKTAYNTNWASCPADMVPATTSRAPSQSTKTITPKARTMATAVSNERVVIRRRAVVKASATVLA